MDVAGHTAAPLRVVRTGVARFNNERREDDAT
jgi:hypothetical protein